jgi:hypothetical protein
MKVHKTRRILFFSVFLVGWTLAANAAELTIHLDNPPPEGTVAFVLFDSANTFGDLRDPAMVVTLPLDGRDVYQIEKSLPASIPCWFILMRTTTIALTRISLAFLLNPSDFPTIISPKDHPATSGPFLCWAKGRFVILM